MWKYRYYIGRINFIVELLEEQTFSGLFLHVRRFVYSPRFRRYLWLYSVCRRARRNEKRVGARIKIPTVTYYNIYLISTVQDCNNLKKSTCFFQKNDIIQTYINYNKMYKYLFVILKPNKCYIILINNLITYMVIHVFIVLNSQLLNVL